MPVCAFRKWQSGACQITSLRDYSSLLTQDVERGQEQHLQPVLEPCRCPRGGSAVLAAAHAAELCSLVDAHGCNLQRPLGARINGQHSAHAAEGELVLGSEYCHGIRPSWLPGHTAGGGALPIWSPARPRRVWPGHHSSLGSRARSQWSGRYVQHYHAGPTITVPPMIRTWLPTWIAAR